MIIMILIVSGIFLPAIPPGTSLGWLTNILSWPFIGLALWHIFLFTIFFTIFYESKHNFQNTSKIFRAFFNWFLKRNKQNEISQITSQYRENARKNYLSNSLNFLSVVLSIALILYVKLIFFTVVISGSMYPTFEKGDVVLMQNFNHAPKIGDIISFKVPNIDFPVTHRVISISGDEIITKGDANPDKDPWRITNSNIAGKTIIVSGKPVVIKEIGNYFLADASKGGRTYGPEFNAISTLIKGIKAAGLVIFFVCILLYLLLSIRDSRRTNW